jgi:long-chain acyl-CoA synthetase
VPDEIMGQALKAFVVPVETARLTEKEVIFHCARRLENFMVPKEIEFRDELPKTSSGKISRKDLQQTSGDGKRDDE